MNNLNYLFLAVTTLTLFNFALFKPERTKTKHDRRGIHACLRTKNSLEHMDEFIRFHVHQGITSISVYDDSDSDQSDFFAKFNSVTFYKHVGGKKIPNENYYIWECMVQAFLSERYEYVLNMDDDEFIHPVINNTSVLDLIVQNPQWFDNSYCIASPVFFFGSTRSSNTMLTTVDFVNRDRDVEIADMKSDYDPVFSRYVDVKSNRHIKHRIEKAIFKVPHDAHQMTNLLSGLGNGIRNGALIHGYSMNCFKQHYIKIAHYTRSVENLNTRMKMFWKGINGLETRFNSNDKIRKYLKERNRTEFVDTTLRGITNRLYLMT